MGRKNLLQIIKENGREVRSELLLAASNPIGICKKDKGTTIAIERARHLLSGSKSNLDVATEILLVLPGRKSHFA